MDVDLEEGRFSGVLDIMKRRKWELYGQERERDGDLRREIGRLSFLFSYDVAFIISGPSLCGASLVEI